MSRAAAVLVVLLAGCAGHTQPALPVSPGTPVFPDFTTYTAVRADDYGLDYPNPGRPTPMHVTHFRTSAGLGCGLGLDGAYCTGSRLPGVSVEAPRFEWSDGTGFKPRQGVFTASTALPLGAWNSSVSGDPAAKVLPPRHSITLHGVTCGADSADGIACIDPYRGAFLLTPGWAGFLEHAVQGRPITAPPLSCSHEGDTTTCRQGARGFSFTSEPGSYKDF